MFRIDTRIERDHFIPARGVSLHWSGTASAKLSLIDSYVLREMCLEVFKWENTTVKIIVYEWVGRRDSVAVFKLFRQ